MRDSRNASGCSIKFPCQLSFPQQMRLQRLLEEFEQSLVDQTPNEASILSSLPDVSRFAGEPPTIKQQWAFIDKCVAYQHGRVTEESMDEAVARVVEMLDLSYAQVYGTADYVLERFVQDGTGRRKAVVWRAADIIPAKALKEGLSKKVEWRLPGKAGAVKKIQPSLYSLWTLKSRRVVDKVVFDPSMVKYENSDQFSFINTFKGFQHDPALLPDEDLAFALDFMKDIICAGDSEVYTYLTQYMAHMVQLPSEIPERAWVLYSPEGGSGKSLFGHMIQAMVTHRYACYTSDLSKVTQQFNTLIKDKLAVIIDEPEQNSSKQTQKIKSLITSVTQWIEGKGVDGSERDSCVRLFFTCNHVDSINLNPTGMGEPADSPLRRRFCAKVVSSARVGDEAFFYKLGAIVESPGFGKALYDYCKGIDISTFKVRKLPKTGDEELFFGKLKPSGQSRRSASCMLDF